jgi:2-C-methyl-D-erythritol 4-phosphate cytidylyltransferase
LDFDEKMKITLVLPGNQLVYWQALWDKYGLGHQIEVVEGGEQRFHSVKSGLSSVSGTDTLVAIHDGVRPLVSKQTIALAFEKAEKHGSGIPVSPVQDTLRKREPDGSVAWVNRNDYFLTQTPQCFRSDLIQKAYEQDYRISFTDDASVVESLGEKVFFTEGNRENIKITTPADMIMAEALLSWENKD